MSVNPSPKRRKIFDQQPSFSEKYNISFSSNSSGKENSNKSLIKKVLQTKGKYLEVINFNKNNNKDQEYNGIVPRSGNILIQSQYQEYSFITPCSPSFKDSSSNGITTFRDMISSQRQRLQINKPIKQESQSQISSQQQQQLTPKTKLQLIKQIKSQLNTILSIVDK